MACGSTMAENTKSDYLKDLQKYAEPKPIPQPCNEAKRFKPKPDPILLKLYPDPHPLSSEEQILFVRITEGAFGFNEHLRNETLQLVSRDYHVRFLAPYLSVFIRDTIRMNIAFPDLSLLIYSVRLMKGLVSNPHVEIKRHLHLLLPAILSCVLSKRISKYHHDNHWTLRDFSAQIVAAISCSHSNKVNQIKMRLVKLYVRAIQDPTRALNTLYGALKGLSCFGDDTVKTCVIPLIPVLSRKIHTVLENKIFVPDPNSEAKQIKRLNDLILTIAGPVLLRHKNTHDGGVSYIREFGYLGYNLYSHVKSLEKMDTDKQTHYNVYLVCAP